MLDVLLLPCSSVEYLVSSMMLLKTEVRRCSVFVELPQESLHSNTVGSPSAFAKQMCSAQTKVESSEQPCSSFGTRCKLVIKQNPNRRIECPPIRYTEQSSSSDADTADCFSRTDASMVAQSAHMSDIRCCVCFVACDALVRR